MLKKISLSVSTLVILTITIILFNLLAPEVGANRLNGRSPFTAGPIQDNKVTGSLAPGEEEWHQFSFSGPEAAVRNMNVGLVFNPNHANQTQFVSLDVFSINQLESWYLQDGRQAGNLGVTSIVSRDNDPDTGELLWQGQIDLNQTYYVRVANDSDFTLDYWLLLDVEEPPVETAPTPDPEPQVEPAPLESAPAVEAPTSVVETPAIAPGTDPNFPIMMDLAPREVNLYQGKVAAQSDRWFEVSVTDLGGDSRQPLDLTLFATPSDGNVVHELHMDLFPGNYAEHWSRGEGERIANFGAGRIVSRDGDDLTGELIWNGVLYNGDRYYVRIRNNNPFEMDYWLFSGDITNAELGGPTRPPLPVAYVAPGTDPNHTLAMETGLNEGDLAPGQEIWYSVERSDLDGQKLEAMQLSLYFTPNDGNNLHRVHLDLFDAGQNHVWSRGDTDQMRNFGAGAIIARDDNPETGELYWDGWLIDGGEYYVRLRNSSNDPIHYWLFTGNIVNPDLGKLATR